MRAYGMVVFTACRVQSPTALKPLPAACLLHLDDLFYRGLNLLGFAIVGIFFFQGKESFLFIQMKSILSATMASTQTGACMRHTAVCFVTEWGSELQTNFMPDPVQISHNVCYHRPNVCVGEKSNGLSCCFYRRPADSWIRVNTWMLLFLVGQRAPSTIPAATHDCELWPVSKVLDLAMAQDNDRMSACQHLTKRTRASLT